MAIVCNDFKQYLKQHLHDGLTFMFGGFGLCGIPEHAIEVIRESKVKNLTVISNNCGVDDFGLGLLLKGGQIKKIIASYVGENKLFEQQYLSGDIEVELTPQGTLAEKIRAGGAGIPAFYTRTGYGTPVAAGKPVKTFNGVEYIEERALKADIAFIKAQSADKFGNLIYNMTAQNFNPDMAKAAQITFAEVEEITPQPLPANSIHTPFIYVNYVMKGVFEKRIERKVVNE